MNSFKERLFTNWHLMRVFRLAIGIMFIVMAAQGREWAMGLAGILFLYQAVTDSGCCGVQGCYVAPSPKKPSADPVTTETIEYQEIK